MARAEGLEPPKASFNPAHATDRELANAVLWTEIGHSFPLGTMTHPIDPDRFRADVLREQLIRSPDVLRAYVGEHVDNPKVMPLLREALVRAGDKTPCRADETPRVLLQQLSMLRPSQSAPLQKANADDKQLYMGLDGRVGTKEQLDAYELGEYVKAMQSETSFGSIAAGVTAVKGGSVEDMRRAGEAGDFLQRLGSLGGGEENVEGKKWPPAVVHGH